MRLLRVLCAAAPVLLLQGCFIFIPGSVVGAVSDKLTGDEGEHCVTRAAKVGDMIRLPFGGAGQVLSLSGTSMRCTNPDMPIRAKLAPVS
jgi:hypothetical protein